jgi:uncharacterized membrane protein (UPF0127 family)
MPDGSTRKTCGAPEYRLCAGDSVVVPNVLVASGVFTRMRGLLGRTGLGRCEAILLSPCHAVHTWFMRFTIDVAFLDSDFTVVRFCPGIRPFSSAVGGWRARHAVEAAAGCLSPAAFRVGARVRLQRLSGGAWEDCGA